jgi:hypothetical protein
MFESKGRLLALVGALFVAVALLMFLLFAIDF